MAKRKEPEVEFVDMVVMRSDGVVVAQRTQPEPKSLIVLSAVMRSEVYLETGAVSVKTLDGQPGFGPTLETCRVCLCVHAVGSPFCQGYVLGSASDPNAHPIITAKRRRVARPPGYPPSPPNLPPGSTPTRIRGPRSV